MFPFHELYPTLPIEDSALDEALQTTLQEAASTFPMLGNPLRIAISIVAIDDTSTPSTFKHAGFRSQLTFYSASLLKVAAMYAAFELRLSANILASSLGAISSAEFQARMRAEFNPVIDNAMPVFRAVQGLTDESKRLPKYEQIFAIIPRVDGGVAVAFSGQFSTNMRKMIIPSNNSSAAACIEALGYSWINGALKFGGYFFGEPDIPEPPPSGIWLAGTYTQSLPYVRIPSVNDGDVAQATTCFDMANLYANMVAMTLVDKNSSTEMLELLGEATNANVDRSIIDWERLNLTPRSYRVTNNKVGVGPLKPPDGIVTSDAAIVKHKATNKRFITVCQNCPNSTASFNGMAFIVDRTIQRFLGNP